MPTDDPATEEAALGWVIRVRDPDFDDWDDLSLWLGADPARADIFARFCAIDEDLANAMPPRPANDDVPDTRPARRRWLWGGGIGAAMAASVAAFAIFTAFPSGQTIETKPGEHRTVSLPDGSRINLNGGTRIMLAKNEPRRATLEQGEATFEVVHNDKAPFIVKVGDAVIEDAGTVFNIVRDGKATEVSVSEGLVIYNPQKDRVALNPGRGLRATDDQTPQQFQVALTAVGSWKRNQLIYNGDRIDRIAADITRATGVQVNVAPDVAGQHFTGTIQIDRSAAQFVPRTAAVLGISAQQTGTGWQFERADGADR